jgi:hypothetical protein
MKYGLTLLAALLATLGGTLAAQKPYELKSYVEITLSSDYPQVMHDFVMLDDGRVAVVGETQKPGQKPDGFFALFEALTFRPLKNIPLGKFRDDALTGVAYAGDGTFYLVGYVETEDKGRQGRALRIDAETEEILFDKEYGGRGDDQFDKIVWLPEAGHGLLAGRSASVRPGYLWMAKADGSEVSILQDNIGDGIVGQLVGMEKGPNCAWLSGYTQRVKNYTRSGDVWVLKVNAEGMSAEPQRVIRATAGQELFGMTGTVDGELYLAGKVGNANGDSDVWLAEVKPSEREVRPRSFGSDIQDCATSLFRTAGRSKWLVVRRIESKELTVQVYSDTISEHYSLYQVTQNQDFYVNRIVSLGDNRYLLAGTSYADSDRSDGRVKLLCLVANEDLRGKGIPEVQETQIRFDDDGHDGKLSPGERGTLRFALKNTSAETPILGGQIQVRLVAGLPGATVSLAPLNLGELPIGFEKNTFGVAVKADKTLKSGQIVLEFSVKVNDREVRSFQATIVAETQPASTAAQGGRSPNRTDLSITEPDVAGSDSRLFIATEPKASVTVRAFSSNAGTKSTDFKTRVNGQVRQDDKSPVEMKKQPNPVNDRIEYVFKQTLELQKGRNVVHFELDDARTDSIVFVFEPKKPNLHLLVIGVPQVDLKYSVKDARDFAAAMLSQRGAGFFNEVFIDTLTTHERTVKDEIVKAFARLERKYRVEKRIKSNDYVVVFMSSHGVEREKDASFGLVTSNYDPEFKDIYTVNYQEMVEQYLNPILCKKAIFIDACHSGSGQETAGQSGSKSDPGTYERLQKRIEEANSVTTGAVTFFSCKANERSWEDKSWQNGAFTEAILEAFGSQVADTGEGLASPPPGVAPYAGDHLVALGELEVYLKKRVPGLVRAKDPGLSQNPQCEVKAPMSREITLFQILKPD